MVDRARDALLDEQGRLEDELAAVNAALKALGGNGSSKKKPAPRRDWPAAQVTCEECGFKAKAPQGLAAHVRQAHAVEAPKVGM